MSLPNGSRAAATWTSRCVSTPPVMPGGASTMVMAIPSFLKRWVDGTAVPDRMTGVRLVPASRANHPNPEWGVPLSCQRWPLWSTTLEASQSDQNGQRSRTY